MGLQSAVRYQSNAGAVVQDMQALGRRIKNPQGFLTRLGNRMKFLSIPANFRAEGRPDKWAAVRRKGRIQQDTRQLMRSIEFEIDGGTLRVGTNLIYAAQRHFGGPIEAKSKYLAIPLDPNSHRKPSDFGKLRWAPGKPGKAYSANFHGFLAERVGYKGRKGRRKPVYRYRFILLSKIEQPPRPFLLFQVDDIAYAEKALMKHVLSGEQG